MFFFSSLCLWSADHPLCRPRSVRATASVRPQFSPLMSAGPSLHSTWFSLANAGKALTFASPRSLQEDLIHRDQTVRPNCVPTTPRFLSRRSSPRIRSAAPHVPGPCAIALVEPDDRRRYSCRAWRSGYAARPRSRTAFCTTSPTPPRPVRPAGAAAFPYWPMRIA